MPIAPVRTLLRLLPLCVIATTVIAPAQAYPDFTKLMPDAEHAPLVIWAAPGAIMLPSRDRWKFEHIAVYDSGNRPVILYSNAATQVNASFILFPNLSGKPTAEGCRADVIGPLSKQFAKGITDKKDGVAKGADGRSYPMTSYLLAMGDTGHQQKNVFAFAGDAKACAEIHLSTVREGAEADAAMTAALTEFHPRLGYQPTAADLFLMGALLFPAQAESAAPYFGESLKLLPIVPETLASRRVDTDQLVLSLGMSGHLDGSRHFATQAIEIDPDYPLNYYNLACADAEEGKATAAKEHLQQAFDRRANVLPGEQMPDPTKDDSILKLKKNKTFWEFVQSLPTGPQSKT